LTLSYSSQAPLTGGLAAGWSLSLPEIKRDPTQSRLESSSRWISSMAGGHELVVVAEPNVAQDVFASFRAQFDPNYIRFERLTNGSWRARTTDGMTHEFGLADHETGTVNDWRLPISRTTDPFGNQVDYFWQNIDDGTGYSVDDVITHIEYTTNPTHGVNQAHAQVVFEYSTSETLCESLPVGAVTRQR
jgi:hypothetical protein